MDQFSRDPFDDPTGTDAGRSRLASRDSLFLAAELRVPGQVPVQVRIRNLSAGGLMAEYAQPVVLGDALDVDLRGVGWVKGRVAWATDGRIGIAFDRAIDPKLARKPVGRAKGQPWPPR